jgi:alpha-N-arabinofuranosidase
MTYYVSASAFRSGCGTKESPFKTIQEAANIAMPGDEVIVAPGVYREYVNPKHAGTENARRSAATGISRRIRSTRARST